MSLVMGATYEIVYRAHGEERTSHAHYRGQGSADEIARGEPDGDEHEHHWFRVDGEAGYLVLAPGDLVRYELVQHGEPGAGERT